MRRTLDSATPVNIQTRRQVIASIAGALGSIVVGSEVLGKSPPPMKELPSTGADKTKCSVHQEVDFSASPQRIYEALLDSKQFASFSGEPAAIGREAGSAFSMFGQRIVGRNIELVPGRRIVQAWRPADWESGVYSIVKFEFVGQAAHTKVILDQNGIPEGTYTHLNVGWGLKYWEPLKKYLS